ncbi:serine hydrolase-domain-containing protein [Globomyces pollinis-pini]|nr:serine hydrolase-domain-containing protein [Globomyces pollinis-pini]
MFQRVPCQRQGCPFLKHSRQNHNFCCHACQTSQTHGPLCENTLNHIANADFDLQIQNSFLKIPQLELEWRNRGPAEKLNILCLHGYTGFGQNMRRCIWKYEQKCSHIADFYYPTAPNPVLQNVRSIRNIPLSPQSRSWYPFENSIQYLNHFVTTEVKKPIDVIIGFSQGGHCAIQLCNVSHSYPLLSKLRGIVIISSNFSTRLNPQMKYLSSVITMGERDQICPPKMTKLLSNEFINPVVVVHNGGHECHASGIQPVYNLLLNLYDSERR